MAEATSYSKVESHCCCPRLSLHKHYSANGLSCCYGTVYSRKDADLILAECESSLVYAVGAEKKVKVYGKWHEIPRKQVIKQTFTSYCNVLFLQNNSLL